MSTPIVGACADHDPELWFSATYDDRQEARIICQSCPAAAPCARAALDVIPHEGMWAGVTTRGRSVEDIRAALEPIAAGAPVPVPERDLRARINRAAIQELHADGMSQAEIAKQLSMNRDSVQHHLAKLGVAA